MLRQVGIYIDTPTEKRKKESFLDQWFSNWGRAPLGGHNRTLQGWGRGGGDTGKKGKIWRETKLNYHFYWKRNKIKIK